MLITIYSKPSCVQCDATCRAFDAKGIDYHVVDISCDEQAFSFVQSLGYRQVPVVVYGENHWSGFRPDIISGLCS
ncbi:glutaredoxin-like protein NrdH [Bartonella sp. B35(2025)]